MRFYCVLLLFLGTNASASPHYHPVEVSAGAASLVELGKVRDPQVGGGVSVTFPLIPRWLETEVVLHALATRHGSAFPIDIVLRLPFHVSSLIQPYIAAGATSIPSVEPQHTSVHWGFASAVGIDFWIDREWGVFTEFNANAIERNHSIEPEIGLFTGVMFGF
jgi:hypothetical protein